MRIQIVPKGFDIVEEPDGRVVKMIDQAGVEVAVGPIPPEKWDEFVAFVNDPEAEKAKHRAKAQIVTPGGPLGGM